MTSRRSLLPVLVFALITLSRIPFLNAGYGVNIDAWRIARVARDIAQTGEYEVSRFPGYPVQEIVCSWFWRLGPTALNTLSALFSIIASIAIWRIGRRLACRDSLLLAAAFAFTPIVFINSVTSKDYVWAIAFVLLALWAALANRPVVSGLLLGLAAGCRITSGAMLIPIALILTHQEVGPFRWRAIMWFAATTLLASAICFLPVWARYGSAFFTFYENHRAPDLATITTRATLELWGTLGLIGLTSGAVVAACFWRKKNVDVSVGAPANPMIIPALLITICLYAVAYLRLPDQAAYLLPIVPAFLFIAARSFPRPLFRLACLGLLFSAWIDFSPAGLRPGSIFSDHEERQKTLSDVTRFVRFAEEVLPGRNVIVVGGWQPMIDLLEPREKLHNDYRGLLSQRELQEARNAGSQVAYAGEMIRAFNFRTTGLDLAQAGGVDLRKLRIAMSR